MPLYLKKLVSVSIAALIVLFLIISYLFIIPAFHVLCLNLPQKTGTSFSQAFRINRYLSAVDVDYTDINYIKTNTTDHDVYELVCKNTNECYYLVLQPSDKSISVVSDANDINNFYGMMDPNVYILIQNINSN